MDRPELLASFKDCLLERSKKIAGEAALLKEAMKSKLDDVSFAIACYDKRSLEQPVGQSIVDNSLYYIYGSFLRSQRKRFADCPNCTQTLLCQQSDLPLNFFANGLVDIKTHGGLNYVTYDFFMTFKTIETVLLSHFEDESVWGTGDLFTLCVDEISKLQDLPPICCDSHRSFLFPELVLEYVKMRFLFETDRKNEMFTSKKAAGLQSKRKLKNLNNNSTTSPKGKRKKTVQQNKGGMKKQSSSQICDLNSNKKRKVVSPSVEESDNSKLVVPAPKERVKRAQTSKKQMTKKGKETPAISLQSSIITSSLPQSSTNNKQKRRKVIDETGNIDVPLEKIRCTRTRKVLSTKNSDFIYA